MSTMSVSKLAKEIHALADNGPDNVCEENRKYLLQACDRLKSSFESPTEAAYEAMFSVLFLPFYHPSIASHAAKKMLMECW